MPATIAFVFPAKRSELHQALPVARALVEAGHNVHFINLEVARKQIELTGAAFHDAAKLQPQAYKGRKLGRDHGIYDALREEHGFGQDADVTKAMMQAVLLTPILVDLEAPGLQWWLKSIGATGVVYHGMLRIVAPIVCKNIGLPCVALVGMSAGSIEALLSQLLQVGGPEQLKTATEAVVAFEAGVSARNNLLETYGLTVEAADMFPVGRIPLIEHAKAAILGACEAFGKPLSVDLAAYYKQQRVVFDYVGPMYDSEAVRRQEGMKPDVFKRAKEARAAGRVLVLVDLGQAITSDDPYFGWDARLTEDGLMGKDVCRCVWRAAFSVFGGTKADEGPLVIVAAGPRADAMEGVTVPANASVAPVVQQVDLLALGGVSVFVSDGDFGAVDEAANRGTPCVVCPGSQHQIEQSKAAAMLGFAKVVSRPQGPSQEGGDAAAEFEAEVGTAMKAVWHDGAFQAAAQKVAKEIEKAGGIRRAVDIVMTAIGA